MSTAIASFQIGDRVELASPVPGRPHLQVGRRGRVLIGSGEGAWGLLTVALGNETRPWQLHPRHLRLIERAPATTEEDPDG